MALEASTDSEPHAVLGRLVGRWEGTARLWLEPTTLACEDVVRGEVVAVGSERWVRHDYTTPIDGVGHAGSALIGFHLAERAWQVAWVDTFHTGTEILFSRGPLAEDSDAGVSVLGSYGEPEGERWGWRTTYERGGSGLLVRHFNITPQGEEALAVELDYRSA